MSFIKEQSYAVVKMLLNQFGIAVMSLMLVSVTLKYENLLLIAALYTTLFYWILLYTMMWDAGAKDAIRAAAHHAKQDRLTGTKVALLANIPNAVIALLLLLGYLCQSETWAQSLFGISHTAGVLWESTYTGFINALLPPDTTSSLSGFYVVAYALTLLPGVFVPTFGYLMGSGEKRIFGSLFAAKKNK